MGMCACIPVTDELLHSVLTVQEFLVKRKQFSLAISTGEEVGTPCQIFTLHFIIALHSTIDECNGTAILWTESVLEVAALWLPKCGRSSCNEKDLQGEWASRTASTSSSFSCVISTLARLPTSEKSTVDAISSASNLPSPSKSPALAAARFILFFLECFGLSIQLFLAGGLLLLEPDFFLSSGSGIATTFSTAAQLLDWLIFAWIFEKKTRRAAKLSQPQVRPDGRKGWPKRDLPGYRRGASLNVRN